MEEQTTPPAGDTQPADAAPAEPAKKRGRATRAKTAAVGAEPTPEPAGVRWRGHIDKDALYPPTEFDGPENEAEAKEAYLRHAGIRSTTGKVVVERVAEPESEG